MRHNNNNTEVLRNLVDLWYEFFKTRPLPPVSFFTTWKRNDLGDLSYAFDVASKWLTSQSEEIPTF